MRGGVPEGCSMVGFPNSDLPLAVLDPAHLLPGEAGRWARTTLYLVLLEKLSIESRYAHN